jgi:hypothetical protein
MFAYHRHPNERSPMTYPHIHLYQGAQVSRNGVGKAHFPTGRIALEDVLRLVITQFNVIPLRNDWEAVLDTTQSAFEEFRTWATSGN